jgi:DNA topoisomerase-1
MAAGKGRKLVIVESPAKAKTIAGYLGGDFEVEASVGHIRDLPNPSELPADMKKGPFGKFAVDVEHDFEPYYVVDPDKRKKVAELKRLLKDSSELYLATDEDREGEAIAWHLLEALKPRVPVKRMVFHEITREAIQRAVGDTRELDTRLVDAQETRRILDRLYGYEVSPVLWRKVRQGLSAGRVQSVATRMVVERERERMAFVRASYWDVEGDFAPGEGQRFAARLAAVDGSRVATGRDFSDAGVLTSRNVVHLDEALARRIAEACVGADARVSDVQEKPYTRRPSAPFTTSTLQQEASRKLRMSSKNAMRVAQRLYENGYITYMRTDSTTLSDAALTAARSQARDLYGAEYVPESPRRYEKKVKNAQEAHEAIRPAGDRFRSPAQVAGELRGEEFALYELIWKRTVASQMADARGSTATVRLSVDTGVEGARQVEFSASGTVITFKGFLAAYEEGRDDEAAARADAAAEERRLPKLSQGVALDVLRAEADGHETTPPARYTEATLVKAMEERGIGRPSTYAATLGTIQDRGYVFTKGQALVPTWLAFAVTRLLEEHFAELVDYEFTASMEEDLDRIAGGEEGRVAWLRRFYFGDEAGSAEGLRQLVDDLGEIDAKEISTIPIGEGMVVRVGRYGPYVEEVAPKGVDLETGEVAEGADVSVTPRRATITDDVGPGPRDRPRHRRPRRPLRPVRHRGARGRRGARTHGPGEEGRQAQAAHGVAVQGHGPRHDRPRRRPAAAQPPARRRRGCRGRRDHRAERPLRALPQEGDRLALAADRAAALRHHARRGAGDLRPAQAARARRRRGPAQGARHRPRQRQARRRQGRPLRPVRHRRGHQRDAAQGRRPGIHHAGARLRAARREARQGSDDPQAGCEEDGQAHDEEGHGQDDGPQDRREEVLTSAPGARLGTMATLVFVHAHPDDEASQTAGSMARAVEEGHRVVLVIATNGDHGEAPPDLAEGETVVDRRRREAEASNAAIGTHRVVWLGYADSGMAGWEQNDHEASFRQADTEEAAQRVAAVLREEAADVVAYYDWHGGYGHPDHVKVHDVAKRAAQIAGTPRRLEVTMNRDVLRRVYEDAVAAGLGDRAWDPDEPMGDGNPVGTPEAEIHWDVDIARHIPVKRAALGAHASQTSDAGMMLQMPDEAFAAMFGHEYYIEAGRPDGMVEGWFLDV